MKGQQGTALVLVLILLGVGGLLLAPTLTYARTALTFFDVSRGREDTHYALEALIQQSLWMLEYQDAFDCNGEMMAFADCVSNEGSWTLAAPGKLTGAGNETEVERVNGQEAKVTIEAPQLAFTPAPTPPPATGHCLYPTVTTGENQVLPGDPVTYNIEIWNCGDKNTHVRRVKVLLPSSFVYVPDSTFTTYSPPPSDLDPQETTCDGDDDDEDGGGDDYYPCPQSSPPIVDGSVLLNWPDGTDTYKGQDQIPLAVGESMIWSFTVTPGGWGLFHAEAIVCYFSSNTGDPGACESTGSLPIAEGATQRSGNVAPFISGMFNLQAEGAGRSLTATAKLDANGSKLISLHED